MNAAIAVTLAAVGMPPITASTGPNMATTPPFFTNVSNHSGVAVQHATTWWQWVGDSAAWCQAPHRRCATIAYESQHPSAKRVWPCVRVATWTWLMRQQNDMTRINAIRGKPLVIPPMILLPQTFSAEGLWQGVEEIVCRWHEDPSSNIWQCL